jgi:hypothetical protein
MSKPAILFDCDTAMQIGGMLPASEYLNADARMAVTMFHGALERAANTQGEAAIAAQPSSLFEPFPKIARLFRECVITEKIDGTNAQVIVTETGHVLAGSRSRLITPAEDNYGFAKWVDQHADELREKLGPGRHYGEWWGSGIQRGYGLQKGEKRFSLFNVARWSDDALRPACCHVVPVIYSGSFKTSEVERAIDALREFGSRASPLFMQAEGVIVWHDAARQMFKVTCHDDEKPKGSKE